VGQRDTARRDAADADARAIAAGDSARREQWVADVARRVEAKAAQRRAEVSARADRETVAATAEVARVRAEVQASGSAADEVNRRLDGGGL